MLWRLTHTSKLDTYVHGENPYAFVVHTDASESFAAISCAKLLAHGFDLIICSIGHTSLQEPLQKLYPSKSITVLSLAGEETSRDSKLQHLSELLSACPISFAMICVSEGSKTKELTTSEVFPDGLFVKLQQLVLPTLIRCSPSALILISDTLGTPSSDFFQSYVESLSRKLLVKGHDGTEVKHIEYYADGRSAYLGDTQVEILADTCFQAIGYSSPHIVPIWSHELLYLLSWLLLYIFPLSFVQWLLHLKD